MNQDAEKNKHTHEFQQSPQLFIFFSFSVESERWAGFSQTTQRQYELSPSYKPSQDENTTSVMRQENGVDQQSRTSAEA